jgi:hypothetical protein
MVRCHEVATSAEGAEIYCSNRWEEARNLLISPGAGAASSLFISRYLLPPEFINVGISDMTGNEILVARANLAGYHGWQCQIHRNEQLEAWQPERRLDRPAFPGFCASNAVLNLARSTAHLMRAATDLTRLMHHCCVANQFDWGTWQDLPTLSSPKVSHYQCCCIWQLPCDLGQDALRGESCNLWNVNEIRKETQWVALLGFYLWQILSPALFWQEQLVWSWPKS